LVKWENRGERLLIVNDSSEVSVSKLDTRKALIEELKTQWKLLWSERFDDRVRAEGVSVNDYAILEIEKGTIIHATKDFKILTLRQILEKYLVDNSERYVQPDVYVGGWSKFMKTEINAKPKKGSRAAAYMADKCAPKKSQQSKKRGWLHAV
jgi:hypothetical protein